MPRNSASPPRRRRFEDDSERSRHHRSERNDYGRRDRERDYKREADKYGYSEADREKERRRDRDRYQDRAGPSRRSASPRRRSQQPRSGSRSAEPEAEPENKAKPNFGASGLLAAETNTVKSLDGSNSTVLKYNEPPEARKPVQGWRLYVFRGTEQVELLHINRQSAYLIGRDRLVADIAVEHPSCSKQHAVIQYRYVKEKDEFGKSKGLTKPFIIDLESTNGTHVNDEAIPTSRYFELKASDVIKFGTSEREYVLLHDDAS